MRLFLILDSRAKKRAAGKHFSLAHIQRQIKLGSGEAETYRIQESAHDVLEVGRKERGAVIVFEPRSKLGHGIADLLSNVGHVPDGSQLHSYYLGEGLLVDDCQCVYKLEYATCSNNIVTQLRGAGSWFPVPALAGFTTWLDLLILVLQIITCEQNLVSMAQRHNHA